MTMNTKIVKNIVFISVLITAAIVWRILNSKYQFAPNLEIVTAVTVLAAVAINWRAAIIVPVISMMISDIIIGNSSIFMFTWGSFALIGCGSILLKKLNNKPKSQIISSIGFATVSSFFFFVITNFGVWIQGWYPATFTGLINSYTMAIPFYRTMLIGNLILVPVVVSIWQLVKSRQTSSLIVDTFIRQ